VRGLRDVSGVQAVVIRHVTVVVFFHQRQIVHEHLLRDFQHREQLTTLEYTKKHGGAHDSLFAALLTAAIQSSAIFMPPDVSQRPRNLPLSFFHQKRDLSGRPADPHRCRKYI